MITPGKTVAHDIHSKNKLSLSPLPTELLQATHPLPEIQAVLFDIYGTLLISGSGDVGSASNSAKSEIFQKALTKSGTKPRNNEAGKIAETLYFEAIDESHNRSEEAGYEYPEVDIERIWQKILDNLSDLNLISVSSDPDTRRRVSITYEVLSNPIHIMPGARNAIESLVSHSKLLGIVSNAQFYTPLLLEDELGESLSNAGFDLNLRAYSYRSGVAKPNTALFTPILAEMKRSHGLAPEKILYVGNDMLNDIYTASICGTRTCLFAGDARSLRLRDDDPRCQNLQPDAIITHLSQLSAVVKD